MDNPISLQYLSLPADPHTPASYHLTCAGTPQHPVMHSHEENEILLIRRGVFTVLAKDLLLNAEAPCLILYKKHAVHTQFNKAAFPYERYVFRIPEHIPAMLTDEAGQIDACAVGAFAVVPLSPSLTDWLFQVCGRLGELMEEEELSCSDPRFLLPYGYLLAETAAALKNHAPIRERLDRSGIADALAFIAEHLTEKITLRDIAGAVHIGKTKLCADFQKNLSVTVHQYIVNERLAASVRLLQQGMSVEEAAQTVGFCDSAHYIRAFRQRFRSTPAKLAAAEKRDEE